MKVNVLRIDEENIRDNEREYEMNYINLITNKTLELRKNGRLVVEDIVTEIFQDEFNFIRITTIGGETKFIIDTIESVNLEKDLKTQQVKNSLDKINEKYVVFIETKDNNFLLSYIDDDSFERRELSNDNESLEDFILRIGKTFVNNK